MKLWLNPSSIADYDRFLRVKKLPRFRIRGRYAEFPDEYASLVLADAPVIKDANDYEPSPFLFDYQADIARLAVRKQKYACFAACGLGKTLIMLEFVRHYAERLEGGNAILIVSPLMVVRQTLEECRRFYGDSLPIEQVSAADLPGWILSGSAKIGITNYDAFDEPLPQGRLSGLVLDESSTLAAHYGTWARHCIDLGRGLPWKMALTGTPAPNDRIEYANHAVFMDAFPTVNSFLAKFFINRGQTDNRWELKPHALRPFYRALSDWCIFLENPATYGWGDNTSSIPPIHVHISDVPMTGQQRDALMDKTGTMFADEIGGITTRGVLSRIAKGQHDGEEIPTNKIEHIVNLVATWPDESTIIWCLYNKEQERIARAFPDAANISGDTPIEDRIQLVTEFQNGKRRVLISKPRILGFGLNLQVATRHVFSGLQDSYLQFHQAIKRSNRIGSTLPLNVYIPVTEIEKPMIDTVLRKAKRVQADIVEQEEIFRTSALKGAFKC